MGEAIAPSLDQTTMQELIAVTTQNILTWGKVIRIIYRTDHFSVLQLLAGTMVASAKTEKRSQRRISATTVCARMGKSRAPYWIAPTVSQS